MAVYELHNVRLNSPDSEPTTLVIINGWQTGTGWFGREDAEIIDCTGLVALPGLTDIHVHFREPGETKSETFESGLRAAIRGGFLNVGVMANTSPPVDTKERLREQREIALRAKEAVGGFGEIWHYAAVTKGLGGEEPTNWHELFADAAALSDDGKPTRNARVMREALLYTAISSNPAPIISHCEDLDITDGGSFDEPAALRNGVKGTSALAEEVMVARDIEIARTTRGRLHIAHISTARSIELVRRAKDEGLLVTTEVTPHHLTLSTEDIWDQIDDDGPPLSYYKMAPPLRSPEDMMACVDGLNDGTIDCIATDHAPHHEDLKSGKIAECRCGVVGLDIAFSVLYTKLVRRGLIHFDTLINALTINPRRVLGVREGDTGFEPNSSGSGGVVLFDLRWQSREQIASEHFDGKQCNSPFLGHEVTGFARHAFIDGRKVL